MVLPSHLPTKDTANVGSGWGMGSLGGWLTQSSFAGARLTDDLIPDMGGRLYGTGAGFNTWQNRADRPTRGTGFSVGKSLSGLMFGKISGASVSLLVSPSRGWDAENIDFEPFIGRAPTPNKKELPVANQAKIIAESQRVQTTRLAGASPAQVACYC